MLRLCCRAQYDELKAKKELIEKSLEEKTAEEEKKRKAQEKLNMKSKKKAKATLSFDADEEEGQVFFATNAQCATFLPPAVRESLLD